MVLTDVLDVAEIVLNRSMARNKAVTFSYEFVEDFKSSNETYYSSNQWEHSKGFDKENHPLSLIVS